MQGGEGWQTPLATLAEPHPSTLPPLCRHSGLRRGRRIRCDDGTLLLLFRGGGPRAAQWIWTYGTQEVQAKCVSRLGSGRAFDVTLCVTGAPLVRNSLTKQSVNVSDCHNRLQYNPLITMAFGHAIAPAVLAGVPRSSACARGGSSPCPDGAVLAERRVGSRVSVCPILKA